MGSSVSIQDTSMPSAPTGVQHKTSARTSVTQTPSFNKRREEEENSSLFGIPTSISISMKAKEQEKRAQKDSRFNRNPLDHNGDTDDDKTIFWSIDSTEEETMTIMPIKRANEAVCNIDDRTTKKQKNNDEELLQQDDSQRPHFNHSELVTVAREMYSPEAQQKSSFGLNDTIPFESQKSNINFTQCFPLPSSRASNETTKHGSSTLPISSREDESTDIQNDSEANVYRDASNNEVEGSSCTFEAEDSMGSSGGAGAPKLEHVLKLKKSGTLVVIKGFLNPSKIKVQVLSENEELVVACDETEPLVLSSFRESPLFSTHAGGKMRCPICSMSFWCKHKECNTLDSLSKPNCWTQSDYLNIFSDGVSICNNCLTEKMCDECHLVPAVPLNGSGEKIICSGEHCTKKLCESCVVHVKRTDKLTIGRYCRPCIAKLLVDCECNVCQEIYSIQTVDICRACDQYYPYKCMNSDREQKRCGAKGCFRYKPVEGVTSVKCLFCNKKRKDNLPFLLADHWTQKKPQQAMWKTWGPWGPPHKKRCKAWWEHVPYPNSSSGTKLMGENDLYGYLLREAVRDKLFKTKPKIERVAKINWNVVDHMRTYKEMDSLLVSIAEEFKITCISKFESDKFNQHIKTGDTMRDWYSPAHFSAKNFLLRDDLPPDLDTNERNALEEYWKNNFEPRYEMVCRNSKLQAKRTPRIFCNIRKFAIPFVEKVGLARIKKLRECIKHDSFSERCKECTIHEMANEFLIALFYTGEYQNTSLGAVSFPQTKETLYPFLRSKATSR